MTKRPGPKPTWQPEMDPVLTEMWTAGKTAVVISAEITRRFGVEITEHSVRNHRFRLKLPNHAKGKPIGSELETPDKWEEWQIDVLYREWPKGTLASVIGAMIGKTYMQVITKRRYCGLPARQGSKKSGRTNDAQMHVWMDHETRDKLHAAAVAIGISASRYIRHLLERDLRTGPHRIKTSLGLRDPAGSRMSTPGDPAGSPKASPATVPVSPVVGLCLS